MEPQFRMLEVARWPQAVRIEWEREVLDDETTTPLEYMDESDDKERIAAWRAGDWGFVGVRAKATIYVPAGGGNFTTYTLTSAGLWGVESDSGEEYFASIFEDEQSGLIADLKKIGEHFA